MSQSPVPSLNVDSTQESNSADRLRSTLRQCGYNFREYLLSPLQFGVPNDRIRYYCVAKRLPLVFMPVPTLPQLMSFEGGGYCSSSYEPFADSSTQLGAKHSEKDSLDVAAAVPSIVGKTTEVVAAGTGSHALSVPAGGNTFSIHNFYLPLYVVDNVVSVSTLSAYLQPLSPEEEQCLTLPPELLLKCRCD